MRVLDVGCGWGTFALHAARIYGVNVVGVTLSREQADYALKRMIDEGINDFVEIRVQDYRDVTDGPYDAIASIGMAEHVGAAMLPDYAAQLYALLRAAGPVAQPRHLPQTGQPRGSPRLLHRSLRLPRRRAQPMATMVDALEGAGFEVRDVESLREHYALTLRAWVANLEDNWDERSRSAAPAGHGSGGSTWPARRWRSRPTGLGSIRFWRSDAMNTVTALFPPPAPNYYVPGLRTREQPAADNALVDASAISTHLTE